MMKSNRKKVDMKVKKQITKRVLMATIVVLSGIALCACQKEEVEVASSPIAVEQDADDKVSKIVNEVVETPKAVIKEVEETTKQADNTVNVASAEIIPEYDIVKEVEVDFYGIVNVGGDKVIPPSDTLPSSTQDTPPQTVVNQEVANQQQEMEAYIAAQQEYERQQQAQAIAQQAAQQAQSTTPPPQSGDITFGADGKPVGSAKPGTKVVNPTTGEKFIYAGDRWVRNTTEEQMAKEWANKEYTNGFTQAEVDEIVSGIRLNVN